MSSGRKEGDEEKKKKKKATVTYNRPVLGQDPAERPKGTATVTGVNSRAEAIEAYRADREKTQEKARQEYKSAIKQYQLKTGKTVDSPNAVTAEDRMWYRASNPTDTALSDTTRRIVEARRNTKQKKQELEDYDNQEYDWTDANARKAHEEGRREKEAAVSQAEREQNQATAESDRAIIGGLSDEGREKLTEYAKQKDRATGPRRESGSEIEQWFAENQHMNADELGNLAETVIRDKNAAHMEQEQQWARDVADAHPFAASAVTVPANLVSGVASTVGNLGQAIDQKLNGEGHYTGLDPYNEANLLQSMSGAARGEVRGNIVGDGSNPLRAIAGGAYDLGMGILDTKARLALGTLTGGGSLVGMGIAGANQFGNAVQDAASRGASTEQALGYAAATSVVDALTEKIPLDNLLSISTAKGGTGRIMQMLSGILGEGAQETASQLASVFTDAGIMRDKSERNLRVAQMMVQNPGMSLEAAQATVDKEILWDMIYNVAIASAGGGFNALLATFERDWKNKKGANAAAQNPQEQPAQEAAEAPDSEKAAPLDGEQMARALAGQEQPARAGDLLAESEAKFDQAFDRVMNQESQKPTPESQTEAPKADTEMERRARMALGMEAEQSAEKTQTTGDNPSQVPEQVQQSQPAATSQKPQAQTQVRSQKPQEIPAAQPEARQEQPEAQNAQQQPQAQNVQPVQQQTAPQTTPQEAQGGAQMAETNGQAQTPGGYVPGAQASAEGKTMKSKSFTNSGLRGTDNDIRESYKGTLAVDPKAGDYQQLRNMDVLDVARERTSTPERLEAEYDYLMKKENLTATDVATTALATKEFFRNGDVDQYVDLNLHKAKTATEAGQVIQAFNIGGTMKDAADPETACETAIKGLSKLNKEMTTYNAEKSGKSFEDWRKDVSMGITRLAIAVESVEDGDTAGMQKVITQIAQARKTTGWLGSSDKLTWNARRILKKLDFDDLKKIANTQIASMPDDFRRRTDREVMMGIRKQNILTSFRSFGRNIGGNATTGLLDSASDSLGGQAMDMLISKFTGKRTTGNDFTHTKAYIDGAKSAADFASLCVELNIPIETDVDASYSAVSDGNRLKYGGKTFRSTGNLGMRLLYGYQKYMNYALEVTDKVFEGGSNAAVAESLEGLRNSGLGDGDIDRLSEFTANRRTFKDATWEATDKYGDTKEHGSALARYGKKVKKGLSGDGALGAAGEFAADSAMPFVGTTMNVTQTGVDYSTGVMKSLGELASLIHDAKQGKTIDVNRQRQVASDFGRGVTGLALIGGFTALAAKGIIRVSNADDKNKKALEQADGLSGAQINWSAAARESTGGDTKWRAGDVISSLDSLEPFNTHMYLGAELAQEDDIQGMLKALPGATAKSVFQAFMDSPMVTGLQNITDMVSDISEAVEKDDTEAALGAAAKYAGETASSFIPQIVKQGAKAADGYYRDTRGQTAAEYAKNAFLTNVPGGAQDLPKKISGLGEEQKRGGIYANLFDTTNSQIYQPNAITESLGALSDATGGKYDKEIYPERQAPMKVNNAAGEAVELDGAQRETYQREYGGKVSEYYNALMKNPDYQKLTDELKAEALKTVKGYAADYARAAVTDYKEVKTGTAEEIGKEAVIDVVTKQMASGINDMQKVWDYGYDEKPAKETLESAYDTYSKMTDSQKAAYRENVSGDTAKYLEAREAGVSTTAYLKVLDAVKHADGTGKSATYRAITSASISDSAMDKLMKAYMPDYDPDKPKSDKTELKYDYARKELGMTPAQYAQAYEIYQSFNGYGKGKAKKQRAALAEIYGADMAKKLYKLYYGSFDVVDWWEDQQ